MMNKQNKLTTFILVGFTFFTWAACNKDEAPAVDKPVIESLEVGHDNNRIAHPGSDLHLVAAILAPGVIASITLSIHPEGDEAGWEFEREYTEGYEGLKNADFHEHIDVPADATAGEYHLHLTVVDKVGNTVEAESHLDIVAGDGDHDDHDHDH